MTVGEASATLADLGPRLCILGPSNSGKSTLANAIARARGLPAVYLDQLHHLPETNWQRRPEAAFDALHEAAIGGDQWVMDGNYSRLLPQRLARATGLILLETPRVVSLARYARRCWFDRNRHGTLAGASDRVRWVMIRHIAVVAPHNRRRWNAAFEAAVLPKLRLSIRQLAAFYQTEGLTR